MRRLTVRQDRQQGFKRLSPSSIEDAFPTEEVPAAMRAMDRIREEIDRTSIVDTHEHITPQEDVLKRDVDLFDLLKNGGYILDDLASSGMPVESISWPHLPSRARYTDRNRMNLNWEMLKPYLDRVKSTAYYKFYIRAFRDLFNFQDPEINDRNWEDLSTRILKANKRSDWYRYVLKEKANIDASLLDPGPLRTVGSFEVDREFFLPLLRVNPFLYGYDREKRDIDGNSVYEIANEWGVEVRSFEDYLELIDIAFKKAMDARIVCIKAAVAYERTLGFEEATVEDAKRVFNMAGERISLSDAKKFEDYIFRLMIEKATEKGLPIQIHTGMHAGSGNILANSNPLLLNNLFLDYPDARFDIFHGGYPFSRELGVLAKIFPNVYLNFCWLPIISPTAAKNCLEEWIELVPNNKLLWGGDCLRVESAYGSVSFAKQVVTEALAEKIQKGYLSEVEALDLAKKIFRENAWELFELDERRH